MGKRRQIDWRREWDLEQIEADEERSGKQVNWGEGWRRRDDWRHVPANLIYRDVSEDVWRFYVVQTCRWREDWDECADWSPADGRALVAFATFDQAERCARQQQEAKNERVGVVGT